MLGRLTQWLTTKLEDKEDDHLRQRFDALTRMKKATLDLSHAMQERVATTTSEEGSESANKARAALTENDDAVHELCTSLENCVKHGLKTQHGSVDVAWWYVLYSSTLVVDEPTLVQGIQTAATLTDTDAGKARCWMKLALNNHTLETSLMIIFSAACEQVVRTSYEDWALVRCDEGLEMFLQMVVDIRESFFCIHVDDTAFRVIEAKEVPAIPIQPSSTETKTEGDLSTTTTTTAASTTTTATTTTMTTTSGLPLSPLASDVAVTADKLDNATGSPMTVVEDEYVEVSSVVFPHRHKGIKPWQHVFGVGLAYLSKNPYHSRFALIDPVLAIPNIVQDCIDILYEQPDTPRLFRTTVLNVTVSQLREMVETDGALPSDLDAHGAGALLLDFFKNLPEPLLTADKYEAFVASGRLKDEEASVRNIACLVQELPVYCKFVLEKLIGVMHFLQLPEHAELNGLDVTLASTMLAPVIAFKSEAVAMTTPTGQRKMSHTQHHDVRFAAIGAQVVERMIQHHDVIFKDVRLQVSDALHRLNAKKDALLSIYQLYKMKPQVNFMNDRQLLDDISDIFVESVKRREDMPPPQSPTNNNHGGGGGMERIPPPVLRKVSSPLRHRASSPHLYEGTLQLHSDMMVSTSYPGSSFGMSSSFMSGGIGNPRTASGGSLGSRRQTVSVGGPLVPPQTLNNGTDEMDRSIMDAWQKHGFNRPSILGNFDKGGVLLLRSVAYMVKNDTILLEKLYHRAQPTVITSYDAGLVAAAICKSLVHLLKLVPSPEHPNINIVALSVEPFWELFDEESYFFKLFLLVFQIFDQLWNSLSHDEASFTRVFCDTEAKVDELLKKSPSSVEDVRSEWEEMWRQMTEEEEGGSTEEETSNTIANAVVAAPPSPPRLSKKPSFTFKPDDYKTKLLNASHILTLEHIAYLDHALPMTCQLCRWCLLYSNEAHGSSLHTLLMLTKNQNPTLIVVKDDNGNVFGGYGSDEWHRSTQYFGNGETFLFTFSPRGGGGSTTAAAANTGANFVKYSWSRRNNYFMLCSEESLVMGGGGSFGLYLDADLSHGTTGPCETFSSRPLVSTLEFNCVHVEVWGFTTSDKGPVASRDRKKRSVLD